MPAVPSPQRAIAELIVASALWGFSFIATRWALTGMNPLWVGFLRFAVSFVFALPFAFMIQDLTKVHLRKELLGPWKAGLWLGLCIVLQTWGLKLTTVTKSSFITCLYVVIVPVLGQIFFKQKVSKFHYFWVVLALAGAALICEVQYTAINIGDWLTLGCAFAAAMQILEVGRCSETSESAYLFTVGLSFWAMLFPAVLLPFGPLPDYPPTALAIWGIVILSFGCSLLAFGIQVRGQRALPASIASFFFLLESPFATLGAVLLLHEAVGWLQVLGGLIILFATAGSLHTHQRTVAT